jgi:hypothetical protein
MNSRRISSIDIVQPPTTLIGSPLVPILGGGVDSTTGFAKFQCLQNATISYQSGSVDFLGFNNSLTFNQFVSTGIQYNGAFLDLLILGFGGFVQYVNTVVNDSYSQSFYYTAAATLPTAIYNFEDAGYGIEALNEFGKGAYLTGNFLQSCGDSFYLQESLGAALFVAFKAEFNSQSDLQSFSEGMSAYSLIGFVDAIGTITSVASEKNLQGNLIIMAYQIGGNPALLGQALDQNGNYTITSCTFTAGAQCQDAVQQILNFSQTEFQSQISINSQGQPTGNPFAYSFLPMNYTLLGLNVESSPINSTIKSELFLVLLEYESWQGYQGTLQAVLQPQVFNSTLATLSSYNAFLIASLNNITANINIMTDPIYGIYGCLQDPPNCQTRLNNINSQILQINTAKIDQIVNSFENGFVMTIKLSIPDYTVPAIVFTLANLGNGIYIPLNSYSSSIGSNFNAVVSSFNITQVNSSTIILSSPTNFVQLWMNNFTPVPNSKIALNLAANNQDIVLNNNSVQFEGQFSGGLYLLNGTLYESVDTIGVSLTPQTVIEF